MNVFHSSARWLLAAGSIAVFSYAAYAQETSMTLDQALARARQRAPRTLAAQDQIREARGRLAGASVFLQENPVVEATAGPRYSTGGDTTDYDVSIAQPLITPRNCIRHRSAVSNSFFIVCAGSNE